MLAASSASMAAPDKVEFNQHIRPILSNNCFACHGPDEEAREADLRLDTAEGILSDLGGYQAVVPGDLQNSELYQRIIQSDIVERMPPEEANKTLTDEEIDLLAQWIREGAEYQQHWSFEPIVKTEPPEVENRAWVKNPIDAFVARRFEQEGLNPSTRADRFTLARRVALDLTGLPPSFETINSFVNDTSAQAYEHLVDRLLAQKDFGEHRAHYWLDAARYADTHGLHLDNYRSIWPYRDWVVRAFNDNMPFDQFTIEQIAGDMLDNPTTNQLIATGFNRSNPTTSEGGAIDEEYLAIYAADRTETTSTVWMGLTLGCARCHDHKFDPITQADFYKFAAFFRNTTQAAMDENRLDTAPFLLVPRESDLERQSELRSEMEALQLEMERVRSLSRDAYPAWQKENKELDLSVPIAEEVLEISVALNEGNGLQIKAHNGITDWSAAIEGVFEWTDDGNGSALAVTGETSIELPELAGFNLNDRFALSFWIKIPEDGPNLNPIFGRFDSQNLDTGWKVTITSGGTLGFQIRGDSVATFRATASERLAKNTWQHVALTYNGTGTPEGFEAFVNGEEVETADTTTVFDVTNFSIAEAVPRGFVIGGTNAGNSNRVQNDFQTEEEIEPKFVALKDIRIFSDVVALDDIQQLARVPAIQAAARSGNDSDLLANYFSSHVTEEIKQLATNERLIRSELDAIDRRSAVTLIMEEKTDTVPEAHILNRGEYDQPRELVQANIPSNFPQLSNESPVNRLDLARWLVNPDHPLTARVTVNRFWQELFGSGLVETPEDFGSQGSPPSHPQLLDWLAAQFIASGWDIKYLFKLMVMSATYQQSSTLSKDLLEQDPQNTLLARGPRYRLDAEVIRDQVLLVSGLLVDKPGGPPVKPYQPEGIWKAVGYSDSNTVQFFQDKGESLYRKSIYTFQKRTAPPPSMAMFDAASRQNHAMRRVITNTPMQALVLMNDPQFVEAARNLAQRVLLAETGNRFGYLLENTLLREADPKMIEVLVDTYETVRSRYIEDPGAAAALLQVGESDWSQALDPIELASWTILASQVFSLDEFITKH